MQSADCPPFHLNTFAETWVSDGIPLSYCFQQLEAHPVRDSQLPWLNGFIRTTWGEIGIHKGPCLAVTLNDRQDYFGQTVNIAAPSKLITVYRGDWSKRLCNGCYGRLLSIYEIKAANL